jgi:hypothetical protein
MAFGERHRFVPIGLMVIVSIVGTILLNVFLRR